MTNETATPAITAADVAATPAASASTSLVEGQILPGVVFKKLDYGHLVRFGTQKNDPIALVHNDAVAGGTHANRKARVAAIKLGDEIAVEIVSIKPPKADDKAKRDRVRASERSIQERAVLDGLKCVTDDAAGTVVHFAIRDVRKDYALGEILDGVAKGYQVILHAINVPGTDRPSRDGYIASLKAGETLSGEILKCERPDDPRLDLRIAVTLTAEAARETKAVLADTSRVYKGTAGRSTNGGIEVVFGPEGSMKGILPAGEVPAATKNGMSVRVRIASIDGDRIVLTRKGI